MSKHIQVLEDGKVVYDSAGASAGAAADAPPDPAGLVGGALWVELRDKDDSREISYTIDKPGSYWLQVGEQSDQNWVLYHNGEFVRSGNGASEEGNPFNLGTGSGRLVVSFNSAALSQAVLDQRAAAGGNISRQHYTLRPA